MSHTNNFNQ